MSDLRERLHHLVDDDPVSPPPLAAMLAARRTRRWPVPVAAAAAVAVVVGGGIALSPGAGERRPTGGPTTPPPTRIQNHDGWQRLADAPLSPRSAALGVNVAGRVLVLGGSDATVSGGPYISPELRDGAALDPVTGSWRTVATAPWPPAEAGAEVVAGDRVLLARNGRGSWLLYDAGADRWQTVPAPPLYVPQPTMAVLGDRVYVEDRYVQESLAGVQVLDLSTMHWSALPPSPFAPAIDDRELVAAGSDLVVMGGDLFPHTSGSHRQPALAEIWDGRRWTRSESHDGAGLGWHWTGDRIISEERVTRAEAAQGGRHDFRAAAFDPATLTWSRLPWLPPGGRRLLESGWPSAEGTWVLGNGYLYDDATRTSRPVLAPSSYQNPAQVLTGDALVLVGGARAVPGTQVDRVTQLQLTNQAWLLPVG